MNAWKNLHGPHAITCRNIQHFIDLLLIKWRKVELSVQLYQHSVVAFRYMNLVSILYGHLQPCEAIWGYYTCHLLDFQRLTMTLVIGLPRLGIADITVVGSFMDSPVVIDSRTQGSGGRSDRAD